MTASTLQLGTWISTGSPAVVELAALCGFDWLLLDLEHGCEPEAALPNQLRAMRGVTKPIVRVGAPHADQIARVLDWGAKGIMVPHVESASVAQEIVNAAYYPPRGRRGLSRTVRTHGYGLSFSFGDDAAPRLMAQIESVAEVKNVDAIAAVDGIDVLFIGPADLRHDLEQHPEGSVNDFDACLEAVIAAARKYGKAAGILCRDVAAIGTFVARGFTEIAVESDLAILRQAYQKILIAGRDCS